MQNKIHFVDKDINVDPEARKELMKRKITGVPTFLIGDEAVVGIDKEKILKLVDHRLKECPTCHAKLRVPINKGNISITCPKCKNNI